VSLTFSEYQRRTDDTAIYPEHGTGSLKALSYVTLGLASEAGEIAGKVKKLMRDGDTLQARQAIQDECGDVLWYLSQALTELGDFGLRATAQRNIDKLAGRKERGTLQGSGDER
jgi:NTP pyrophosphatase (non-canonical NTP hydrolase)